MDACLVRKQAVSMDIKSGDLPTIHHKNSYINIYHINARI